MAHFAKLDSNNIVTEVLVVNNEVLLRSDNTESEEKGKQFLNAIFGQAEWVQTSYNGNFRKQYAGIGYTYDSAKDKFIAPQPFVSWTLDSNDDWQPPTARPNNSKTYNWNEQTLTWDLYIPTSPFSSWTWNQTEWIWEPPVDYPADYDTVHYQWNEDSQTWDLIA